MTAEQVKDMVHEQLKELDTPYTELESFTGLRPLEVTILSEGAFKAYTIKQQKAGAELAHLKPPRLNPSDDIIEYLISEKRRVNSMTLVCIKTIIHVDSIPTMRQVWQISALC